MNHRKCCKFPAILSISKIIFKKTFGHSLRRQNGGLVNLIRYADDFIVTGRTRELLETEVKPPIEEHLRERGLARSLEKTKTTQINEGFDFLGQNVRQDNGKMLITPSQKNVNTFLDKVREIIKSNVTAKAGNLIRILNPVIRGLSLPKSFDLRGFGANLKGLADV